MTVVMSYMISNATETFMSCGDVGLCDMSVGGCEMCARTVLSRFQVVLIFFLVLLILECYIFISFICVMQGLNILV